MADFHTLDELQVTGKRVIVRTDLNVPVSNGDITDVSRIERAATTIRELSQNGARVIVISHFGRPKGPEQKYSQRFLVAPLAKAIGRPVAWVGGVVGVEAEKAANTLRNGEILLTENVRFHVGEEGNDADFARALAKLGDVYVNDAFSAAHRAHASTTTIANYLPAYAGRLMQAELESLGLALDHPAHPVVAIVGGAKISTKLRLLRNLLGKIDTLVLAGGMANTFLFAQGSPVGKSLCETEEAAAAREILALAKSRGCRIVLPEDAVVAERLAANVGTRVVAIDAIPADRMILDIGPASVNTIIGILKSSRTLVWNGPLGAIEIAPFDAATSAVARAAASLTAQGNLVSVAGGGETAASLAEAGVTNSFTYVSTAGGAFLEWLEGRDLPGVAALRQTGQHPIRPAIRAAGCQDL